MLTHQNPIPSKPKRVVILGARGFISSHLLDWCVSSGIDCMSVGSEQLDLSNVENAPRLAALLRPDDAIVMTSILTPEKGRNALTLMYNLRMAETVCLALDQTRCAHFVHLSSDCVYGAGKTPLDEDSPREPTDFYALSHIAQEMMFRSELGKKGIPLCILRSTAIYGSGDTHNSYGPNRFVRTALHDGYIKLFGNGEELRSHVFIDDAIKLIGLVLEHRSAGTLIVAIRPSVSFDDIAQIVIHLVGKPVEVKHSPRTVPVLHRQYKPGQLFRFMHNLVRSRSQVVHRTFMNSALFEAFPDFCFTPLEKGLALVIESERSRLGTSGARSPELSTATVPSEHK